MPNMGGTEILSALKHVIERRKTKLDMASEVILLTDGEAWDIENIVKFVQEARNQTQEEVRFFALGIGDAVSHTLIEGIGRHDGGFAEVVAVNAVGQWESRVIMRIRLGLGNNAPLPVSNRPAGTEGTKLDPVAITKPPILQAPNKISSLHAFSRSLAYTFVDTPVQSQIIVIVEGVTSSGERAEAEVPLERIEAQPLTIHHLAAKALVNDLKTGQSWMYASHQEYRKKDPLAFESAVKREVEQIGTKWSISGKWTSFIAVDNSDQSEIKSRIYRAKPPEIADLTRPMRATLSGMGNRSDTSAVRHFLIGQPRLIYQVLFPVAPFLLRVRPGQPSTKYN
jgi:hypothetical protein